MKSPPSKARPTALGDVARAAAVLIFDARPDGTPTGLGSASITPWTSGQAPPHLWVLPLPPQGVPGQLVQLHGDRPPPITGAGTAASHRRAALPRAAAAAALNGTRTNVSQSTSSRMAVSSSVRLSKQDSFVAMAVDSTQGCMLLCRAFRIQSRFLYVAMT